MTQAEQEAVRETIETAFHEEAARLAFFELTQQAEEVAVGHLDDPLVHAWHEEHPDATAEELMEDAGPWTLPAGVTLEMVAAAMRSMV